MKKTLLTFIFLFAFVVSSFGQSTTKEVSVQESDGSPRYKVSTIEVPAGALAEGVMKDGNKLDLSAPDFDSFTVGGTSGAEFTYAGGTLSVDKPINTSIDGTSGSGQTLPRNSAATNIDFNGDPGMFTKDVFPFYLISPNDETYSFEYNLLLSKAKKWDFVDMSKSKWTTSSSGYFAPTSLLSVLTNFSSIDGSPLASTITYTTNDGYIINNGIRDPQPDAALCIGSTDYITRNCDSYATSQITANKYGAYVIQWHQISDDWIIKGTDAIMAYATGQAAMNAINIDDFTSSTFSVVGAVLIQAKSDTDFVPNGGDLTTCKSVLIASPPPSFKQSDFKFTNYGTAVAKAILIPDVGLNFIATTLDSDDGVIYEIDNEYDWCNSNYIVYARIKFPTSVSANERFGIGFGNNDILVSRSFYPTFDFAGYADSCIFIGMRNSVSSTNLALYTPDAGIDLDEDLGVASNNSFHDFTFFINNGNIEIWIDGTFVKETDIYCDVDPGNPVNITLGTEVDANALMFDVDCDDDEMIITDLIIFDPSAY